MAPDICEEVTRQLGGGLNDVNPGLVEHLVCDEVGLCSQRGATTPTFAAFEDRSGGLAFAPREDSGGSSGSPGLYQVAAGMNLDAPWTVADLKDLYSRTDVGRAFLEQMRQNPITIIGFDSSTAYYRTPAAVVSEDAKVAGYYDDVGDFMMINTTMSLSEAALTFYHEYQHKFGAGEEDAYYREDYFAIAMGWPAGFPGADGIPDREYIKAFLGATELYTPMPDRIPLGVTFTNLAIVRWGN